MLEIVLVRNVEVRAVRIIRLEMYRMKQNPRSASRKIITRMTSYFTNFFAKMISMSVQFIIDNLLK